MNAGVGAVVAKNRYSQGPMNDVTYAPAGTGLVVIDPLQRLHLRRRHGVGPAETVAEGEPGDIVAQEHWCSSGFANTDVDLLLKRRGIRRLIVIGLRVAALR